MGAGGTFRPRPARSAMIPLVRRRGPGARTDRFPGGGCAPRSSRRRPDVLLPQPRGVATPVRRRLRGRAAPDPPRRGGRRRHDLADRAPLRRRRLLALRRDHRGRDRRADRTGPHRLQPAAATAAQRPAGGGGRGHARRDLQRPHRPRLRPGLRAPRVRRVRHPALRAPVPLHRGPRGAPGPLVAGHVLPRGPPLPPRRRPARAQAGAGADAAVDRRHQPTRGPPRRAPRRQPPRHQRRPAGRLRGGPPGRRLRRRDPPRSSTCCGPTSRPATTTPGRRRPPTSTTC